MKKMFSRITALALVFAIFATAGVLFGTDTFDPVRANPDGGLNGSTCLGADFDETLYTDVTTTGAVVNGNYRWPSSGSVLITASGSRWNLNDFNGITIPAGLTVDIYRYYKFSGDPDKTYDLLGHFDTTDGNPHTISSNDSVNVISAGASGGATNGYTGTPDADGWTPNYSTEKKWGTVRKTFVPGTPSASYNASYTDVTSDAWYYHAVMTLSDNGILGGYGDGRFGPNDSLTRAQIAIIADRLRGLTVNNAALNAPTINNYRPFKDNAVATRAFAAIRLAGYLPQSRYVTLTEYERTLIADSAGLSANDEYKVCMYEPVYDLWRASLSKNIKYRSSIDQFPDADAIYKWIDENAELMGSVLVLPNRTHEQLVEACKMYFLRAYNLGMFSGVDAEGTFDPYGTITRGQYCQALYNVGMTYKGCTNYNTK